MKSKIIKIAGLIIALALGLVIIVNSDFSAESLEGVIEEQNDPYCEEGANVNSIIGSDKLDRLSGAPPLKSYRCRIVKIK